MQAAAQPELLKPPLAGGQQGATVKITALNTGGILAPPAFLVREPGRMGYLRGIGFRVPSEQKIWIAVPAFLVEHPGAGRILVDTGLHQSIASDPKQQLGIAARLYTIRMQADQSAVAQLRRRGIDPASIETVIMTHLHWDHASAISDFTGAKFIVGQGEWAAANAPRGLRHGYVRRQVDHAVPYLEVDYSDPGVDSYASFGRSVDLFGDGSVRLCFTPGHSAGHQSLIFKTANGEVLLAGDAAIVRRNYLENVPGWFALDEHRQRVSLKEIGLYAEQEPDATIVPSHDPEAWKELAG